MPNEFKIKNGLLVDAGGAQVTGSLIAPNITGSLQGTASWALNVSTASFVTASAVNGPFGSNSVLSSSYALTASYALNAGGGGAVSITVADEGTAQGAATFLNFTGAGVTATVSSNTASINIPGGAGATFPYTGSAIISGSLQVIGTTSVTGSILVTQSYISRVDWIDFTVDPGTPAHSEGRVHWNVDAKTLELDTDVNNFMIPVGHASVLRGRNTNSYTLTKGTVVFINGNSGQFATFGTASWEDDPNSAYTIGVLAQDINTNNYGYAITDGEIRGVNTNAYAPATLLYLSSSGQYTDQKPVAPLHAVRLGQVVVQSTSGILQVKVDNGYETDELHDVRLENTASGDLLIRSGSIWINSKQLTGSYGVTGSFRVTGSLYLSTPTYNTSSVNVLTINTGSNETEYSTINDLTFTKNIVNVGLPGSRGTRYNVIKTAVQSITDAAENNTYTVRVAPGVYIEDTITVPSWVAIKGDSSISTVVSASNPSASIFVMSDQSMIIDMQIQGSTGPTASAVVYSSPTTPQRNAIAYVENVRFGTNYTNAKVIGSGSSGNCILQCSNVKYGGYTDATLQKSFDVGFHVTSGSAGGIGRMQLRNVTSTNGGVAGTDNNQIFALADAPGCTFIVNGCLLTRSTGTARGTAFKVYNGGQLRLTAVNFQRWINGIWAPQTGSAPSIDAIALNFENCTTDVLIEHTGSTGKVQGTDNFLKTQIALAAPLYEVGQDPRRITVGTKGADFTSISASVAYITDSSENNRYVIEVGPGQFTENTIDLTGKPYVSIVGSNIQTTQIFPSSSAQHIIKMGINNEVSFLSLANAGPGYSALYVDDIGDFAQAHKVSIYDCDRGITVAASTTDTQFYGEYIDINGSFSYGAYVSSSNGASSLCNIENYYLFPSASATIGNYATGPSSSLNLYTSLFKGDATANSIAVKLESGATLEANGLDIQEWDYGYVVPNVGPPPLFRVVGSMIHDSVTYDFDIQNANTVARYQGVSDHNKINNVSPNFYWNFLDDTDGENDITRKLSVTFADGTHTDATTLIFKGSPMGVMQGGTISIQSGLTITTAAGFGYLQDAIDVDVYKRIDWNNTNITLAANTNNYIYLNDNAVLSASGTAPDSVTNIILGRVVTNDTGIEFIDQIPYDGEHTTNAISKFAREALGPVFAEGSVVSQNVTPFKLDVTQGNYYFAENNFLPSGTSSINLNQYYISASAWARFTSSVVPNNVYASGSQLVPMSASYYTKHTVYLVGDGADEEYFLVINGNQYSTLVEAEGANLPTIPTYFSDGVVSLAAVYVQSGSANITQIEDIRPVIGFRAAGVNASAVHGNLLGLSADDHTQYLLVDGGRQMSGDLGLGGNDIYNFSSVSGSSITASGANITNIITNTVSATSLTGSLLGTATSAVTASYILQAISASYSLSASRAISAGNASTIDINVFGADVESYVLMSNVAGTTGVAIGGDADLRYNSSTNKLSVGSVSATSLTGSLLGTSSWAVNAITASFVTLAQTASFVTTAQTASFVATASWARNAVTASFITTAQTASFVNTAQTASSVGNLTQNVTITGSLFVSSSIVLTPSGSITVVSGSIRALSITGSLLGTSSWAQNAVTASFITTAQTASFVAIAQTASFVATASWANNAVTASFVTTAQTASFVTTAQTASSVGNLTQNVTITGSLLVSSSIVLTPSGSISVVSGSIRALSITGSLLGTSSWAQNAVTASFVTLAQTASFVTTAQTASYVLNAISSSFASTASFVTTAQTASFVQTAQTASYVLQAVSASFATTASFALNGGVTSFNTRTGPITLQASDISSLGAGIVSASTFSSPSQGTLRAIVNGVQTDVDLGLQTADNVQFAQITGSNALFTGTVTAQSLIVQTVTSSVAFVTGSTQFGSQSTNTHQFTGSVSVSGSLSVVGRATINNLTGSLFGTSSWANNATTASFVTTAQTASYVLQAVSASFASTASFVNTLNQNVVITGSLTIGTSSVGSTENTLIVGPSPAGGVGEGGQILLQAPGGTHTSASMRDNYQNLTRLLRGTNAGSDAIVASFNMHTKQIQFPAYNGASAFVGTAAANLAVDSSGNVITVSTSGGTVFPYVGTAIITGSLVVSNNSGNSGAITASGAIISLANGAMYFRGGDDAELWDINVANTVGVYGQQDQTIGGIKLGSGGGTLTGKSGNIGVGTIDPGATLHIQGNVSASSFTGSLFGTASWALNVVGGAASTFPFTGSAIISGSLQVTGSVSSTGGFTGSLFGTSSWAEYASTASFVTLAQTASFAQVFPYTGSAIISGSLQVTGSVRSTGGFTGSLLGTASLSTRPVSEKTGNTLFTPFATSQANYVGNGAVYLGDGAGYTTFTGDAGVRMVAIGYRAGYNAYQPDNSIFIGANSGLNYYFGFNTIGIGNGAAQGDSFNTGPLNFGIGIGGSAGAAAYYADYSNFIGGSSGQGATNASYANFIGTGAGTSATNAKNSNFIGYNAGGSARFASQSVFLGHEAGYQSVSSSNSIFIGHKAGYSTTTNITPGINNIIIGTNISLSSSYSNGINIGAIIFGSGAYGNTDTSPLSGSVGNGRIGINVVVPNYNLDVSGSGNYTSGLTVTGSVTSTGGFTGSLFGTSSWALNVVGGAVAFPYTGSAQITGSLGVTGSFSITGSGGYNVLGDTQFSGSVTSLYGYTGSLFGTASFAVSASWAPGGGLTTKAGSVANSSFAGNPKKATVTFSTAFPNTSYAVVITGEDARSWTIESKVAGSFVINANSNTSLSGTTYWIATAYGES